MLRGGKKSSHAPQIKTDGLGEGLFGVMQLFKVLSRAGLDAGTHAEIAVGDFLFDLKGYGVGEIVHGVAKG